MEGMCVNNPKYPYTEFLFTYKWAWQAQFLSHAFEILGNDAFFKDVQMISLSFFNIKKRVELSCGQLVKKNIN